MLFLTFILAYGVSGGGVAIQGTLNLITADWPVITSGQCSFSSGGPAGSCGIVDSWGLGLVWVFASLGSFFVRMGASLFLVVQLINVTGSLLAIPFFGEFVLMIQLFLGLYAYSQIRANPHGLGGST